AANAIGDGIGRAGGLLAWRRLHVGATSGGVDYLVAMAGLLAGWFALVPAARSRRGLLVVLIVAAAHLLYLMLLVRLSAMFPAAESRAPAEPLFGLPTWAPRAALKTLVPWNLPALAAV